MPHVVAITRAPRVALPGSYRESGTSVTAPLDTWLASVASCLSMTPYDLRLKVAGSPPWIVARPSSAEEAGEIVTRLRDRECGAVGCDVGGVVGRRAPLLARAFVEETATRLEPEGREIPHAAVVLLVRATIEQERAVETVRFVPQTFDGITRHTSERARSHALYVFPRGGLGVRLLEGGLRLVVGASTEPPDLTARARFESFVDALRQAAPSARYESGMVDHPRKRTTYRSVQPSHGSIAWGNQSVERASTTGNLEETDLAAHLLAQALEEGQL